jgi:ABC-type cobalamin/Fe3+-siderophores transport system ATPase subunit
MRRTQRAVSHMNGAKGAFRTAILPICPPRNYLTICVQRLNKLMASSEIHLRVLRLLEANPHLTQRELADELGISLGKANYCLKALLVKGLIKMQNFSHARNKLSYAYLDAIRNRRQGTTDDRIPADQDERAITILNNLGMVDKANHFPGQLSGGQKQRVALARSLMMQPELLLCDEPTSGLDVATILDVISLLQSVRDMGVTMMIASHDLDFLTKTADRIIVLKNGEIALDVNPKTLTDPVFYLKNYY